MLVLSFTPMKRIAVIIFCIINVGASAQRFGTGLVFDDDAYQKTPVRISLSRNEFAGLPLQHSLKFFSPPPGNQLQLNTSPAWAVAWSAKSILESINGNAAEIIPSQYAGSPAFLYQQTRETSDKNCESGIGLRDALEFMKSGNVPAFEDFMEFCPKYLPKPFMSRKSFVPLDYRRIFDESHADKYKISAVKKSISQNLPVVIGMHCPPSFFKAKEFWQPGELMNYDFPGQALCVVGYDDEKYGGAFEVINSWGKDWGNDGFMWIRYGDFISFTRYAYEVHNFPDANEIVDFSGNVQLKMSNGKILKTRQLNPGVFMSEEPFRTGTHFRVHLKNERPAYIYVFGIDDKNEIFRIFPYAENISPAMIYSSEELAIPGEDNYIEIIGDPGQEKLFILYSGTPINFNEILVKLSDYPGDLMENLDGLLDGAILNPAEISWNDQGISFNAKTSSNKAILIQIQIDHI